jgi:hypothetical protein
VGTLHTQHHQVNPIPLPAHAMPDIAKTSHLFSDLIVFIVVATSSLGRLTLPLSLAVKFLFPFYFRQHPTVNEGGDVGQQENASKFIVRTLFQVPIKSTRLKIVQSYSRWLPAPGTSWTRTVHRSEILGNHMINDYAVPGLPVSRLPPIWSEFPLGGAFPHFRHSRRSYRDSSPCDIRETLPDDHKILRFDVLS